MPNKLNSVVEEEDAAVLKFPREFDNAETLTIAEVLALLNLRKKKVEMTDSNQKFNDVFLKTLEHCKTFNRMGDNQARLKSVRNFLQAKKLHKFELAQMANLCPDTAEEARTFIPSLEANFQDEELSEMLNAMCNS